MPDAGASPDPDTRAPGVVSWKLSGVRKALRIGAGREQVMLLAPADPVANGRLVGVAVAEPRGDPGRAVSPLSTVAAAAAALREVERGLLADAVQGAVWMRDPEMLALVTRRHSMRSIASFLSLLHDVPLRGGPSSGPSSLPERGQHERCGHEASLAGSVRLARRGNAGEIVTRHEDHPRRAARYGGRRRSRAWRSPPPGEFRLVGAHHRGIDGARSTARRSPWVPA